MTTAVKEWVTHAACAHTNPNTFFPEIGRPNTEAKHICQQCPVRPDCLEHALTHHEWYGIWGGLSDTERRKLRRASMSRGNDADYLELSLNTRLNQTTLDFTDEETPV